MLKNIMKVERVNFYLCDSKKNEIYKRKVNEKTKEEYLETHSAQKGICGYVANTGLYLITDNVEEDTRFNHDIDDPQGENTRFLLTAPLPSAGKTTLPRGIMQLCNKENGKPFSEEDYHRLCIYNVIVARCEDVIMKLEEFYSMQSVMDGMIDISKKMITGIDNNTAQYHTAKRNFSHITNLFSSLNCNSLEEYETLVESKAQEGSKH